MKKRIFILVSIIAIALIVSFTPKESAPVTGSATADGFGGKDAITVTVSVRDNKIIAVDAQGPKETVGIGSVALEKLPAQMVETNNIQLDAITGATYSSNGVLQGVEAALKAAGLNPEDFKKAQVVKAAEEKTIDTDIVIVGAGGAGMVAAIVAADAGKNVVLVEKQAIVGGNSARATGGMNATHTPEQDKNEFTENAGVEKTLKAAENFADNEIISKLAETVKSQWEAYKTDPKGYFDSVELMQLDSLIGGHGINNAELVKTFAENAAGAIEWLKTINIDLTSVGQFGGASVKRIHRPLNEDKKVVSVGAYMIPRLEAACTARKNITILIQTTAQKILTDENKNVSGIFAVNSDGDKLTINAKAVILAAGGFGANLKMVALLKPELDGFMTTNAPGIDGEGIVMAQELGAAVVDMKQIQIHPTVQADTSALITEGLRGDGAILVNKEGKRFIDETSTRDVVSAAEIAQTGSFSWLVVDQKMADASSVIKGYISRGYTLEGNTYEELARVIDVPADEFTKTMNAWNKYVVERNDKDFGRTSFAKPLDSPPFYAIKVTAGIHHTMGGLKIDKDAHVLRGDGSIIPGLFAAGEITGGVHGGNRLGGNAVADFVIFGRIAGQNAAKF
ncbi:MAG: flavocytochrome c [Synergistaceae bacterium]|nr:flavocytochrome c [Synergistaceae bacterium]